jgi:hypothetical protein
MSLNKEKKVTPCVFATIPTQRQLNSTYSLPKPERQGRRHYDDL